MKNLNLTFALTLSAILIVGCTKLPSRNDTANNSTTSAVPVTDIPTSGILNCSADLKASMRYRPGHSITPNLHRKLSQFGCKATLEYKTSFLQGIRVSDSKEELTKRCKAEVEFIYKRDFWLTSFDPDYRVQDASFLLDQFRGSILQTNISGSRNVQCFATVEAIFRKI